MRLEAKGVEGGNRQRVLYSAVCARSPPGVGDCDGMGRIRGQLPIADVHDGETRAALDRPRVVLVPHRSTSLRNSSSEPNRYGMFSQPQDGANGMKLFVASTDIWISPCWRARTVFCSSPKPHVGIQLKCEGAARIFLGQFDQLPVGHVDVVLFARATEEATLTEWRPRPAPIQDSKPAPRRQEGPSRIVS